MFAYLPPRRMENRRVNAANVSELDRDSSSSRSYERDTEQGSEIKCGTNTHFELCVCWWKFKWFRLLNLNLKGVVSGDFRSGHRWIFQAACDLFWRWRSRNRLRGRGNWQFAVANDERFKIIIVGSIILSNCNLFYYV